MTLDPRDEIDRIIDEALASVVAGEPRRVSAASVRQSLIESRAPRIPSWLAVAAVLLVGFAVALRNRVPVGEAPPSVAGSAETAVPGEAQPATFPEPIQAGSRVAGDAALPLNLEATADPPYEGMPRLVISSIDLPKPLSTSRLEADPIQIPRLEIAPLSISSLSIEREHHQ